MFEFNSLTSFLAYASLVTILLRLIYKLLIKHWNYFSDRNIQFERGLLPVIGTFFGDLNVIRGKKPLPERISEVYKKHSDRKFIGIYDVGGFPSYLIRDPELINKICIKDFDYFVNHFIQVNTDLDPLFGRVLFMMPNQEWRDMRSTLSPLFTGSKMRQMLTLMNECANDFTACVRTEIKSKSKTDSLQFDMDDLLLRLSNDIIGSTAFGIQTNSVKEPNNEFFTTSKSFTASLLSVRFFFCLALPKMAKLFKLKIIGDKHDRFFRNLISTTIAKRKEMNVERNDMLNLLLLAKEGKLDDETDKESEQDTGFATVSEILAAKKTEKLKNWNDDDLLGQSLAFFLAGSGLNIATCYLCYELAVNSTIQERLFKEIQETNDQLNGAPVTFEALQKMKYLDMVVSEIFRKWPFSFQMDRKCNKQYMMEDCDGTKALIQPNDVVWIPIYALHRDPKYYPNPEVFDPERFSDENKKNIRPGTYLPFGMGPRACIANRFALLQIKAVLYNLVLNFKIECSEKTQVPLKLKASGTVLAPQGGFFNQLRLRK